MLAHIYVYVYMYWWCLNILRKGLFRSSLFGKSPAFGHMFEESAVGASFHPEAPMQSTFWRWTVFERL